MSMERFERAVLMGTGQSADFARKTPIGELRRIAEEKLGRPLKFVSSFPWIGRGSIMRDRLVSHEDADAAFEEAIQDL